MQFISRSSCSRRVAQPSRVGQALLAGRHLSSQTTASKTYDKSCPSRKHMLGEALQYSSGDR